MDNFDNFYKNDNDDDHSKEGKVIPPSNDYYSQPRVIFQQGAPEPQNQEPEKHAKLKKKNAILLGISIVLFVAFIANIIVLASFKNEISSKFASNMSYQAQVEYKEAIDTALSGTDVVDDVTTAATNQAIDLLTSDIGETVADACLDSVVIINCSATGQSSSTATGFLINEGTTRYILTNEHVVTYDTTTTIGGIMGYSTTTTQVFSSITCQFYNSSSSYTLSVVDYDEEMDLALLKFSSITPNSNNHPAIKLAASNTLSYGEEIVLIGNPEGIGIAVSTGTVSIPSLVVSSWGTSTFIMTNAAVNPGNSGGPMLNRNGVCVGIVESKLVSSNVDNMGFAVDIDSVWTYLHNVEQDKGISIGYIVG